MDPLASKDINPLSNARAILGKSKIPLKGSCFSSFPQRTQGLICDKTHRLDLKN